MDDVYLILANTARSAAELVSKMREEPVMGFDTESSGPRLVDDDMLNVYKSTLTGLSVAFPDKTAYYVPIGHRELNCPPESVDAIYRALEQTSGLVWCHNWKHDIAALRRASCRRPARIADSLLLMWVLGKPAYRPNGDETYALKSLCKHHFGRERPGYEHVSNGRQFADLHPREALEYAAMDAWDPLELALRFSPLLDEQNLSAPFWEQEMPCVEVVRAMEDRGFGLDAKSLEALHGELTEQLSTIRDQWEFLVPSVDIGSCAQVSDHFYAKANGCGERNLWPTKGVARGATRKLRKNKQVVGTLPGRLSVNKDSMALASKHPGVANDNQEAAGLRLEFQALDKSRSTYTTTLIQSARQHDDERIHASFHQAGTRTGRFSSSTPNLQNISSHSTLGKRIKGCFVASPGNVLVVADYSQIELRVLAHFAKAGHLFDAYMRGLDVHQETATKVEVTRDLGKTLNFAIIYGAGAEKLSKAAAILIQESRKLLKAMRELLHVEYALRGKVVDATRRRGFVKTLSGRIRWVPQLSAHEGHACQRTDTDWKCEWCAEERKGERIAFNTLVQGSAADIVKRAMLSLHNQGAPLIGQVHDEVILEVPEAEAEQSLVQVVATMRDAASVFGFRVPLEVGAKIGRTWAEAK